MKIGVLMGGISSEREVSLKSGKEVVKYLDKNKYDEIIPIILDSKEDVFTKVKDIDFAFLALHGEFGEDGTIQGILEAMNLPYSGCGVLTSSICMDKDMTKKILKAEGITTAPWITVKDINIIDYDGIEAMGYPVFIKPNKGGSSVGTFLIESEDQVLKAVEKGLNFDKEVIIEKYIRGTEITSFILNGEVFPTITIEAKKGSFFDYASKYEENGSDEKYLSLKEEVQEKINLISKTCWRAFKCKGYCRVDMIISEGVPHVLEINTLPGLTATSLIPKSAKAAGISFTELLNKIIEYSIK